MAECIITIDGKTYIVPEGITILQACRRNGIWIPTLCYDERLDPYGGCRMCLVEVEGVPDLVASCVTTVCDKMIVRTNTERVQKTRKAVLELILSDHPNDCMTCEKDGDCDLQDLAYKFGIKEDRFGTQPKPLPPIPDRNPMFERENSKCILCGRCVRICDELEMAHVLTFGGRGMETFVTTAFGKSHLDTPCVLCGQCVSTCPTGALIDKHGKGIRARELKKIRTTCPYCGVGCQIDLNVKDGRVVRITSEVGCIPNDGNTCVKGRFGHEFIHHPDRLTTPLIKRNDKFEPATWDEALDLVARRFSEIRAAYGPDSLAGLSSAKCTNEENYLFQKFIRVVFGTNNVDHCARLCHASTVAGLAKAFGSGAMTNSIAELEGADCIFVIGSNTSEAHPVIALRIKQAVRKRGAKLIVADPRAIPLTEIATLHLQHRPGSDVALINAMMNVIIGESLHNQEFINTRTEGFADFVEAVKPCTPELAEKITGVPADNIRAAARMYATAPRSSIVYSMGITQHSTGTDNVLALANLAMLTGQIGRESTGVNPLRGQNNVQGACDMGALPNVLPGYQDVTNPDIRKKFEEAWGRPLPATKGLTVVEILHAAEEGKIHGLYFMGENPGLSDPNINRTLRALQNVEFLVVQDLFLTETAQYAHVILPVVCFAEKDGTYTNTERRVQRVRKAVPPPGLARADWEIICDLSTRMGYPMKYTNPAAIMEEIASLTPIYGGISYERIEQVGLQWPCPTKDHPGTPILHKEKFTRGLGKFHPTPFIEPAELPDSEYPFILSTGRMLHHYHTGTMTRRCEGLNIVRPSGYVEISEEDAHSLGIRDGDEVQVTSRRGSVRVRAAVTPRVARGVVFMTFHFREAPANVLTNDALDPVAKIPEFKVCAVKITRAAPA